jgi:hypothetical protein
VRGTIVPTRIQADCGAAHRACLILDGGTRTPAAQSRVPCPVACVNMPDRWISAENWFRIVVTI